MTYTEKELDQFLHGISLSLLSKKSAQHWRYDEETAKEIEWLEVLEQKVRADKADRKTEPTISKMEQVDKDINVRSKDEPQRNMAEDIVESFGFKAESYRQAKAKTEPQTEIKGSKRLLKGSDEPQQKSCATCKHALGNWDGESNNCGRCCGADRRFYEPKDEPQTDCLTCRYNSDEWDSPKCDGCSKAHSNYEPQTERKDK